MESERGEKKTVTDFNIHKIKIEKQRRYKQRYKKRRKGYRFKR